jgi:hypothetical protein
MEGHTVIQKRTLEELADGNGERAEQVLKNIGQLELLGVNSERYASAVFELADATLIGITNADDASYEKFFSLGSSLVKLTHRIGAEVYEELFMILASPPNIDQQASISVIQAGAKILKIRDGVDRFPGMDVEKFMSVAKKVLLYMAKRKTPKIRTVVVELLANFGDSDIKQRLDEMMRGNDMWVKDAAEEAIAVVRAREDLRTALKHEKALLERYPYEGHPKRYFVSAVYDSMKLLMAQTNERNILDTIETASVARHLIYLAKSFDQWKKEVFDNNPTEADTLRYDIQNALFHVVKRANNRQLAKDAAATLATGGDDRVKNIIGKMLRRKESGHEFVGFYTLPKPSISSRKMPPPVPQRKIVSR